MKLPGAAIVEPTSPLRRQETAVAELLARLYNYSEIGELLGLTMITVRTYATSAASKVPGDLPQQSKLVASARGASLEVIEAPFSRSDTDMIDVAMLAGYCSFSPR